MDTYACIKGGCKVCAYKVLALLPKHIRDECTPCPRPEQCLRRSSKRGARLAKVAVPRPFYAPECSILILGDGDFSYSLGLARSLSTSGSSKGVLISTCYLNAKELFQTYGSAKKNIQKLKKVRPDCKILHSVDATRLQEQGSPIKGMRFDRIIWNFPCLSDDGGEGKDAQNGQMVANQRLLRLFYQQAFRSLHPDGEVHLLHKTKRPFSQWGLPDIAQAEGLIFEAVAVFDRELYPGYVPRKAASGAGSFPIFDSRIYIFRVPCIVPARTDGRPSAVRTVRLAESSSAGGATDGRVAGSVQEEEDEECEKDQRGVGKKEKFQSTSVLVTPSILSETLATIRKKDSQRFGFDAYI
eukprot:g3741.t1